MNAAIQNCVQWHHGCLTYVRAGPKNRLSRYTNKGLTQFHWVGYKWLGRIISSSRVSALFGTWEVRFNFGTVCGDVK